MAANYSRAMAHVQKSARLIAAQQGESKKTESNLTRSKSRGSLSVMAAPRRHHKRTRGLREVEAVQLDVPAKKKKKKKTHGLTSSQIEELYSECAKSKRFGLAKLKEIKRGWAAVSSSGAVVRLDGPKGKKAAAHLRKIVGMSNSEYKIWREGQGITVRKPAKRKPAKRKPAKRKPAKRNTAKRNTAKLKPAKLKPAKRKPAKRKPAKREYAQRGTTAFAARRNGLTVRVGLVAPKRLRKSKSHKGKSHKRTSNPLMGAGEFVKGIVGLLAGGFVVDFFDRLIVSHAISGSTAGSFTDAPSAGQTYNAEAQQTPIWASWGRMGLAAVAIALPFSFAAVSKGSGTKAFFQLAGSGAIAVTGVKLVGDVMGALTAKSAFGARLWAPEIMAQTDRAQLAVNGSPLPALTAPVHTVIPSTSPPTLAGVSHQVSSAPRMLPAPRITPPAMQPMQAALTTTQAPRVNAYNPEATAAFLAGGDSII